MKELLQIWPANPSILQKGAVVALLAMATYVLWVAIAKTLQAQWMRSSSLKMIGALGEELIHQRVDSAIEIWERYSKRSHLVTP